MTLFEWQGLAQRHLPDDLAAGPVNGQGNELLPVRHRQIVVVPRRGAWLGWQSGADRNRGCQIDSLAPDDWRRVAAARNRRLPADVGPFPLVPCEGRIAL